MGWGVHLWKPSLCKTSQDWGRKVWARERWKGGERRTSLHGTASSNLLWDKCYSYLHLYKYLYNYFYLFLLSARYPTLSPLWPSSHSWIIWMALLLLGLVMGSTKCKLWFFSHGPFPITVSQYSPPCHPPAHKRCYPSAHIAVPHLCSQYHTGNYFSCLSTLVTKSLSEGCSPGSFSRFGWYFCLAQLHHVSFAFMKKVFLGYVTKATKQFSLCLPGYLLFFCPCVSQTNVIKPRRSCCLHPPCDLFTKAFSSLWIPSKMQTYPK